MAKQTGDMKVVGTVEGLCFYKLENDYFVRRKSSLTRKRFQRDPAFEGSRRSAGLLARASRLASALYRSLPKENKSRDVFRQLTGALRLRLRDGRTEEEIKTWFEQTYLPKAAVKAAVRKGAERKTAVLKKGA